MSAKTMRRTADGRMSDSETTGNLQLDRILDEGTADAYKRPWHRLERGLRLNRLRAFVDEEARRTNLTEAEAANLLILLQKALDKKMLNSKTTVIYEPENETIKEIKGLVSHRAADGVTKYQFVEKRAAVTMRRKRNTEAAVA